MVADGVHQRVTEALARSYRLPKNQSHDPFNVIGQIGTQLLLSATVVNDGQNISLVNQAGRYPASSTLLVCDSSTWGTEWNWDYTEDQYRKSDEFALVNAD